jgi:hypothetical protein
MATGLSVANANAFLNWLFNGTAMPAAPAGCWIQLHVGDPGAAGTANIAGNTTREDLRAAMADAAAGAVTNDVLVAWSTAEVDTAEDYTHWSAWSANAAGTFLCSGLMTANAVQIGDEFVIPVGDLDAFFAVAA